MRKNKNSYTNVLKMLAKDGANFEHYRAVSAPTEMLSSNVVTALNNQTAGALMTPVADFRSPVSAASFDILIYRATNNINAVLPVPVFGVLDQESDWTEIMSTYLPAGCTYEVTRSLDKKSLDFTFNLAGDIDVVTVSCNQVPYVNLLISGLDSTFRLQQNKLQISDVAKQAQFSQSIGIFNRSFFGHHSDDSITPNQYKSDLQNQNDIRTINQILDIDKQRTILYKVISASDFTITMSTFVQKYDKGASTSLGL